MDKKNIDELFQEKFKDFQEIPDDRIWDSISKSLDQKKSRRPIPIWWKLGGVAALLAIGFIVVNPFENEAPQGPVITDIENPEAETSNQREEDSKSGFQEEIPKDVDQVTEGTDPDSKTDSKVSENGNGPDYTRDIPKEKPNFGSRKKNTDQETQLATSGLEKPNPKTETETSGEAIKNTTSDMTEPLNEALAEGDNRESRENPGDEPKEDRLKEELNRKNSIEESLALTEEEKLSGEPVKDAGKKSIFEEVEKQKEEKEAVAGGSGSKWSVGANLAPVYFDSFGNGSSIDPSFRSNSKSGDLNFSYGLSVAYDIDNRLQVRTGINKVDYSYSTNEIEFSPSLEGAFTNRLSFVDYTSASENVIVESKNTTSDFALGDAADEVFSAKAPSARNGTVAQEFGYIEIPVELNYTLVDRRLGVNLIGGISSMFLTNNSVALNSSEETVALGEANNLNTLNFSTNVGFGLNYRFTSKIRLNVEPIFKYQLNTFSDTAGRFNPFSVGLYSGLNFRF